MGSMSRFFKKSLPVIGLSLFAPAAFGIDVTVVGTGTSGGGNIGMIPPMTISKGAVEFDLGAGVLATHPIAPGIDLETGLLYIREGGSFNVDNIPTPFPGVTAKDRASVRTAFLRLPILVHYTFFPMLSAGGGFYFGRGVGNIKGNHTTTVAGTSTGGTIDKSYSDYGLNSNDFGIMLDANYEMPIKPGMNFYSSIKMAYGLVDLAKSSNALPTAVFNSYKIVDLSLLLGVKFSL